MKLNFTKLAVTAGVLTGIAGSGLMATPAHAVPAASTPGATLTAVGSDTTYWMMYGIHNQYNVDNNVNTESPKDRIINVPPVLTAPFPSGAVTVADSDCAAQSYDVNNLTPPNGSGAGITALNNDATGCIDFARSSRGQKVTDPASDEFYAYALDALSWARFPGSHSPINLTQQNLIDIYTCDPITGAPFVSDWSTVGGAAGTIKKYAPQTSSGTYSFFNSKILNGATIDAGCDIAHKSTFLEEHDARGVLSTDKVDAILPFSYAQWTAAGKAVIADLRNLTTLGSINSVKPGASTINEVAPVGGFHFLGTRYVFNVAKTTAPRYNDVMRFTGIDNAGPGFICNNGATKIISLYGFTPLKKLATGGGVTITSYCRKNPAAL